MHVLVFQHVAAEPPAAFARHMASCGDTFDVVRFFEGDEIPPLACYDALLVMGGPMDVWDVCDHAWLKNEMTAIRTWVRALGRPYLGVCLGHQLLAQATGGACSGMTKPEIGLHEVLIQDHGRQDSVMRVFPENTKVVQWHGVDVCKLPEDAVVLASNAACAVQAMRVGDRAWGLQFHPEILAGTLQGWMSDPANLKCAQDWMGSVAQTTGFVQQTQAHSNELFAQSNALWQALRKTV